MGRRAVTAQGASDVANVTRPTSSQLVQVKTCRRRNFLRVFGWSGALMVLMFLLSGSWTLALAVIQLFPIEVANYLMDTTEFDYGDFWILAEADNRVSVPSASAFLGFSVAYFWLVARMIIDCRTETASIRQVGVAGAPLVVSVQAAESPQVSTKPWYAAWHFVCRVVYQTASQEGILFFALPKLILQTTILVRYLREGFPVAVISSYSTLLLLNWTITSFRFVRSKEDARNVLVRIIYSFDLFFAVFAPLQVLLVAAHNFSFNRDVFRTRTESFLSSNFEKTARLFADPTEVSLFRIAFQSLQLTTPSGLAIVCLLNIFTIRKWKRMIDRLRANTTASATTTPLNRPTVKRLTRLFSSVVFVCGAGIFVYSIVAVASTKKLCRPHTECKVPSYKWNVGASHCSCLVFINRFTRMKTYSEWLHPEDTTESLRKLATTGDLKIVQIVNRQLPTLPDELRLCTDLMQLVLLYTKITAIPQWTKDFTKMEYFHIQGDFTPNQLTSLPSDLLLFMPRLRFLYFGTLPKVPAIPDLSHLPNLKYLMLALMHSITSIPSLDGLISLEQLTIIDAIQVESFPSTKHLRRLKMLSLDGRNVMCCNGFMDGVCNLKHFACLDRTASGEPPVRCTARRINQEEYASLSRLEGVICLNDQTFDIKDTRPTPYSVDAACSGVVYKQCKLGQAFGMCFPSRMMPISCQILSFYQDMRRLQIGRKVGEACDPNIEAWLGCTS